MLNLVSLACVRGERQLFADLDVAVPPGTCLHVAGENGAGKTSLLRIICGLLQPDAGEVRWKGTAIRSLREEFWQDLAYLGHLNGVKDDLTALENVAMASAIADRAAPAARSRAALATFGLAGYEDAQARSLSQGQRRRIALARLALAEAAPLWVLDEPFTALDNRGVAILAQLIGAHLGRQGIVVMTTHQDVALPVAVQRLELTARRAAAGTA
jgi:heme exporter protein A